MSASTLSAQATGTTSGSIAKMSCGSDSLNFSVECMGAPWLGPDSPATGWPAVSGGVDDPLPRPRVLPGLTKARRQHGESMESPCGDVVGTLIFPVERDLRFTVFRKPQHNGRTGSCGSDRPNTGERDDIANANPHHRAADARAAWQRS